MYSRDTKFRWLRVNSLAGLLSVLGVTLVLSCNQIQAPSQKHEIETAPSIQSEENQENKKEPLATGGDMVFNQQRIASRQIIAG